MVKCICIYKGVNLKYKPQNTGTSLPTPSPLSRLCYRPTVIFFHLCPLRFLSPSETLGAFQKYYYFIVLGFLKYQTSETAEHEIAYDG
jgi:hypothetical protein